MKTKKYQYVLFAVSAILALLISACGAVNGDAPAFPSLSSKTEKKESTPVPAEKAESTGKTDSDGGMLDVGELLTPQVTAQVSGMIEWSLDEHVWGKYPGLEAPEVAYYDTGVDGEKVLESMPGLTGDGIVLPDHAVLICGGTDGKLVLNNGYAILHSDGFYFALTPGTQINSIWLKNGFCLARDRRSLRNASQHPACERGRCWRYADSLIPNSLGSG
jgi:hypothetical protein